MAKLVPVEGNPFEQAKGPKLVPVEGNPFETASKPEGAQRQEPAADSAAEDLSIFRDLDQAFMKIPGAPALAEFASAANRSVFDMVDFLGPDTVNAVLELAGSERRMPTARETFGSEGGYMQPGLARDVVQESGEVAPMAVAFGQLLRTAAGRLPAFSQGESAGAGTVRQLANSKPTQDFLGGAGAGAGGQIGEAVGGENGRLVGATLGAGVSALPGALQAAKQVKAGRNMAESAAPSVQQLKGRAGAIYQQLDDSGVTLSQPAIAQLTDDIASTIKREGFNARIHPKIVGVLDELSLASEKPMTISEIDTLRRVAQSAARSIEPDEKRLGSIAIDKIDDFLDDVPMAAVQGGDASQVGPLLREARGLWSQARKTEMIQQAFEKAKNQASGFENGIRVQFRSMLNNPKKMRGFSEAEKDAIKRVVRGDTAENIAKAIGKFGFTEGQASSMLLSSLGVAGGASVGGPVGALAVPAIGQYAKNKAAQLTARNAKLAEMLVRSGRDGRKIISAYYRAVPAKERSVEDLTGLLLQNRAIVQPLRKSKNQLVSNAAIATSILSNAEKMAEQDVENGLNDENGN